MGEAGATEAGDRPWRIKGHGSLRRQRVQRVSSLAISIQAPRGQVAPGKCASQRSRVGRPDGLSTQQATAVLEAPVVLPPSPG